MREKIASLVDQIRRCAADLDYLASEEEEGFDAGLEREEQKIAKRIERIAYALDELEKEEGLSLPELDELDDLEEEEVISSLEEELNEEVLDQNLEEEEMEEEEEEEKEEESADEEMEEEEVNRRTEILQARQAAQLKRAGLKKVACVCTKCGHEEKIAMKEDEINKLASDFKMHKGEVFGPECEKCPGELIPTYLFGKH